MQWKILGISGTAVGLFALCLVAFSFFLGVVALSWLPSKEARLATHPYKKIEADEAGMFRMLLPVRGSGTEAVDMPQRWSSLGGEYSTFLHIYALAVDEGGNVVAGGDFDQIFGIPARNIVQWNGASWIPFDSGVNGRVNTISVTGDHIYVGGKFDSAGQVAARNIAVWNGSSWAALGEGTDAEVRAIAVQGNYLIAGGNFDSAGSSEARNVAFWNGDSWSDLEGGINGPVNSLAVDGMDVYAAGAFDSAGNTPASNIAIWNWVEWSSMGEGTSDAVTSIHLADTALYAGGNFLFAGGKPVNYIASWNGSRWSALGNGLSNRVQAIQVSGGEIFAGGKFNFADTLAAQNIAKWDGVQWTALGGTDRTVTALALRPKDGALYVGGEFKNVNTLRNSISATKLARYHDRREYATVELASFSGSPAEDVIELTWTTISEANTYGFNIERKLAGHVTTGWSQVAFVPGRGCPDLTHTYTVIDRNPPEEKSVDVVYYRLTGIDGEGEYSILATVSVSRTNPFDHPELHPSYPNPFRKRTTLSFTLPESQAVTVSVFNSAGNEIARPLDNASSPAGFHNHVFRADGLPSGVYFVHLSASGRTLSRSMLLQ